MMKEWQLISNFVCWYDQYISFPSLKEGMKQEKIKEI